MSEANNKINNKNNNNSRGTGMSLLQRHLQELFALGLISLKQRDEWRTWRDVCLNWDESVDNDETQLKVVEVLTQEPLQEEEAVRASDGNCYSRQALAEFAKQGSAAQHQLPIFNKRFSEGDYRLLEQHQVQPLKRRERGRRYRQAEIYQLFAPSPTRAGEEERELKARFDNWKKKAGKARSSFLLLIATDNSLSDEEKRNLVQRLLNELGEENVVFSNGELESVLPFIRRKETMQQLLSSSFSFFVDENIVLKMAQLARNLQVDEQLIDNFLRRFGGFGGGRWQDQAEKYDN